eukprot:jgi/Chlat1/3127/Chrsp21S03355
MGDDWLALDKAEHVAFCFFCTIAGYFIARIACCGSRACQHRWRLIFGTAVGSLVGLLKEAGDYWGLWPGMLSLKDLAADGLGCIAATGMTRWGAHSTTAASVPTAPASSALFYHGASGGAAAGSNSVRTQQVKAILSRVAHLVPAAPWQMPLQALTQLRQLLSGSANISIEMQEQVFALLMRIFAAIQHQLTRISNGNVPATDPSFAQIRTVFSNLNPVTQQRMSAYFSSQRCLSITLVLSQCSILIRDIDMYKLTHGLLETTPVTPATPKNLDSTPATAPFRDVLSCMRQPFPPARKQPMSPIPAALVGMNEGRVFMLLSTPEGIKELVDTLSTKRLEHKETSIARIRQANGDSDVDVLTSTVSLKCPISCARVPARTAQCTHTACFDLATHMMLNASLMKMQAQGKRKKDMWTCPICRKAANWRHLIVDEFIWSILRETSEDVCEVMVQPDASWSLPGKGKVVKGENAIAVVDLSSETSERKKPRMLAPTPLSAAPVVIDLTDTDEEATAVIDADDVSSDDATTQELSSVRESEDTAGTPDCNSSAVQQQRQQRVKEEAVEETPATSGDDESEGGDRQSRPHLNCIMDPAEVEYRNAVMLEVQEAVLAQMQPNPPPEAFATVQPFWFGQALAGSTYTPNDSTSSRVLYEADVMRELHSPPPSQPNNPPEPLPSCIPSPMYVPTIVNINTASYGELRQLPGIGPILAKAIVEGRPYCEVRDLRLVRGFGPMHMIKLAHRLAVDDSGVPT